MNTKYPLFLADENFNNHIVAGIQNKFPGIDVVRVQDFNLSGVDDPSILEFAASQNRILVTHDAATIPFFAYQRLKNQWLMPGVFVIKQHDPLKHVLDALELLIECSEENEWTGKIVYIK